MAHTSPKELRTIDMMNLMKNYEITTKKNLSSERARNFQIELTIPPIEKQW